MGKLSTASGEELVGGGTYLKEPGIYHFVVNEVLEGVSTKGKAMNGDTIRMECLGGTQQDCSGKKFDLALFLPDPQGSEGSQRMSEKQCTAFWLATGVILPEQLGGEVEYEEQGAVGKQLVIRLAYGQSEDENGNYKDDPEKGLRMHFADIWHVDDPACKDVPKNKDALDLIDSSDRHSADWFAFKSKAKPSRSSNTKSPDLHSDEPIGAGADGGFDPNLI